MDNDDRSRVTDQGRAIARRLLTREAAGNQSPEALAEATVSAFDRLNRHLSTLIGPVGYEALLRRALHLAKSECPQLVGVTVGPLADGTRLGGLRELARTPDPSGVHACLTVLLGDFIGLLASLVGMELTRHLIRGAWPEFGSEPDGSDFEETER